MEHGLTDYEIVRADGEKHVFEHMTYYPKKITVINARYINFSGTPSKVKDAVELACYKLMAMNPNITLEELTAYILGKMRGFMWSSQKISVIEEQMIGTIKLAYYSPDRELARKAIYSKADVVWHVQDGAFDPPRSFVNEVFNEAATEDYWFGAKKKRYLDIDERKRYMNMKIGIERRERRLEYYYETKKKFNLEMNREKIQKAFDELKVLGKPITHANLAIRCDISEDVASKWLMEYVDIAEQIKAHNKDLFGHKDGRRNRKVYNIRRIKTAIIEHGISDKQRLKEITGLSISAIYNLWHEEEIQRAIKNVKQ